MSERLILGSVPAEEDCTQLGEEGYGVKATAECRAFIGQLKRAYQEAFGKESAARFRTLSQHHDFGTYYEVAIEFESSQLAEFEWFDQHTPTHWDQQAREELSL